MPLGMAEIQIAQRHGHCDMGHGQTPLQEHHAPGLNRIERPGDYGEYRLRLEAPAGMALAEVELLQPVKRQAIP